MSSLYKEWLKVDVWSLKPGDHIRTFRGLYYHHMLVVEVVNPRHRKALVIHYATPGGDKRGLLGRDNEIIEEVVTLEDNIERVVYKDDVHVFKPEEAIRRARERLHEKDYNVLSNNCESFLNDTLTSVDITDQGLMAKKAAKGAAIGVAVAAGIATVAVAAGVLKETTKASSDKKK